MVMNNKGTCLQVDTHVYAHIYPGGGGDARRKF